MSRKRKTPLLTETDAFSGTNSVPIRVSELAKAVKKTLENSFGMVRVRGEISGYRGPHTSGHTYFTLKDQDAVIDAIVWKAAWSGLVIKPEEGADVIATGRMTTFVARSKYQLIIESLEFAGLGAALERLEARRRHWQSTGAFDVARKKPLPFLPRVIGVVTSTDGVVIRDIIHRLSARCPCHLLIWPVHVQGPGSAEEVAAAIRGFGTMSQKPDVVIVARGGGSIEDLWGFNDDNVIQAALDCTLPLISAIGHETDWTLLDYVADVRAPTPTAAAELCVPVRSELLARIAQLSLAFGESQRRYRERLFQALPAPGRNERAVRTKLALESQALNLLHARLKGCLEKMLRSRQALYEHNARGLSRERFVAYLQARRVRQSSLSSSMALIMQKRRMQALSDLARRTARVDQAFRDHFVRRRHLFAAVHMRHRMSVQHKIVPIAERERGNLIKLGKRLVDVSASTLRAKTLTLNNLAVVFAAVNYRAVLERGFVLVRGDEGVPIKRASEAAGAERLTLCFADASLPVRKFQKRVKAQS